eukprot:4702727-Amphidinium_carterae.1
MRKFQSATGLGHQEQRFAWEAIKLGAREAKKLSDAQKAAQYWGTAAHIFRLLEGANDFSFELKSNMIPCFPIPLQC